MTPLPVIAAAAGRRLARHLDRLHETLEGLGERLREAVQAVVREVLTNPDSSTRSSTSFARPCAPPGPSRWSA
jgi:hypothetical protein